MEWNCVVQFPCKESQSSEIERLGGTRLGAAPRGGCGRGGRRRKERTGGNLYNRTCKTYRISNSSFSRPRPPPLPRLLLFLWKSEAIRERIRLHRPQGCSDMFGLLYRVEWSCFHTATEPMSHNHFRWLVNNASIIEAIWLPATRRVLNWKRSGRKRLWPDRGTIRTEENNDQLT
jgi:hypothetical protein